MIIMLAVLYIFIGLVLGGINMFGIMYTTKEFVQNKSTGFLMASFMIRLLLLGVAFYFLMAGDWRKAVFMLVGFTLAKVFSSLIYKNKEGK